MSSKQREALVAVKKLFDGRFMFQPDIRACHKQVNEALAEPQRNCDRFGGDIDKLREACLHERGLNPDEDFPEVFCEWLLEPAKEEERVKILKALTKAKGRCGMTFAEAIEQMRRGAMVREKGSTLWTWRGASGQCYYGHKRNHPLQFRGTFLCSEVFGDDEWEVKDEGGES